jgi:hypothetical protein
MDKGAKPRFRRRRQRQPSIQRIEALGLLNQVVEGCPVQGLFGGEIIIDGRRIGACTPADLRVRRVPVAFLGKDLAGFLKKPLFCVLAAPTVAHNALLSSFLRKKMRQNGPESVEPVRRRCFPERFRVELSRSASILRFNVHLQDFKDQRDFKDNKDTPEALPVPSVRLNRQPNL